MSDSAVKNLVLCFDGTGDWAAKDFTNVMKLYQRLDRECQAVYYSGGVGTLGSPIALSKWRRMLLRILDLATATSLRDRVLDGYNFIVNEYEEGCRIYLFGFSRGAFTARLVAALVHSFGILERRNGHLAPYLWEAISELRSIQDFKNDAKVIRQQFGRAGETKIHVMGLFDTVSSVGVLERFQVYPYTDKNPSVSTILHAVSLDEQRNCFPELLILPDENHVEEVWFRGVHRDIGGGCSQDFGLENDVLHWMLGRLEGSGLVLREASEPESPRVVHVPFFDWYVFAGLYPQLMFDYGLSDRLRRNFSLWRPWAWFGERAKDPGFRYFWPNFKHIRRVPWNGFEYAGEGQVRPASGKTILAPGEVANTDAPKATQPMGVVVEWIGTTLGVAFAFLIANSALREPAGQSWPHPLALWGSLGLFLLSLLNQGFRQWIASKSGLRWLNDGVAIIGLLAAAGLGVAVWSLAPWPALLDALGVGAVAALAATLGRTPILIAQRAVPLVFFPWLVIAALAWLAGIVLDRALHIAPESLAVLAQVAEGLAVFGFLSGVLQMGQDRRKMQTPPSTNPVSPRS